MSTYRIANKSFKCIVIQCIIYLTSLNLVLSKFTPDQSYGYVSASQVLKKKLLKGYDRSILPVKRLENGTEKGITIYMDTYFQQLVDVDESSQSISYSAWVFFKWEDGRWTWDEKTDPVDILTISPHEIWLPDTTVWNAAGGIGVYSGFDHDGIVLVKTYPEGRLTWLVPTTITTECTITADSFPYDVQFCQITMGSWTNDVRSVKMALPERQWEWNGFTAQHMNSTYNQTVVQVSEMNLSMLKEGGSWSLVTTPAVLKEVNYGGLIDGSSIFSEVHYHLVFKRMSEKYTNSLLFPCVLFYLLCVASSFVPAQCGERLGICLAILISIAVYQAYVSDIVPTSQNTTPIFMVYRKCWKGPCLFIFVKFGAFPS